MHGSVKQRAEPSGITAEMVEALTGAHRVAVGWVRQELRHARVYAANATAHVAQNNARSTSAIDGRTIDRAGYRGSQTIRMRIEEFLGWAKIIGGQCKHRFVGPETLDLQFVLTMAPLQPGLDVPSGRDVMLKAARGVAYYEMPIPKWRDSPISGSAGDFATPRLAKMRGQIQQHVRLQMSANII